MPKKTSETETVETMNMELSTPGTAEDTAVSMTENENSEIALGSAEEIVEKPDETVSPTTETAEADIAPDGGVEGFIFLQIRSKPKKPQTFLRRLKTGRKTQP